jgi:hypothetical protein
MITLFSVVKPFKGEIDLIQRNAVCSWKAAFPGCQIILFGTDIRLRNVATVLGVEFEEVIFLSPLGAPLLNHIFEQARRCATNENCCFVNADIIFTSSSPAIHQLPTPFLVIGRSYDALIRNAIDFGDQQWKKKLPELISNRGPFAIDYFFFSQGVFLDLPPFRVGRARYDNWLIYRAIKGEISIIDGTEMLGAIHQTHDYSHLIGGRSEAYRGDDAKYNEELAGWWCRIYLHSVNDSQFQWTKSGLHKRQRYMNFERQLIERFARRLYETFPTFLTRLSRHRLEDVK